ncbi:NAD(P)-dependent oxidoreductase [Limnohabitans curvus]|uniref:dTDP-4-dehydrorhamnose reductase n=1 Tax=Limnohabitans curvus TaxID=323423 RepID=A0A315EVD9_9BURK|nr:NAD(P)-dependent oxidoreductase [Limnohabitans curvus]
MRLLVLGATGMLGNAVLRLFTQSKGYQVFGSVRSSAVRQLLPIDLHPNIFTGVDVENIDSLTHLFAVVHPDVVINCVGLVKQLAEADDPLAAIPINALLPHRLARLCEVAGARLVHMSTDCVFSGAKGNYVESDLPDAYDLYGRSKLLGEVDYPNAITLRTSIIGHELAGNRSLIDWFLSQTGAVQGYKNAIFSGLPTVEIARIIHDHLLPNPDLHGLYHVSAEPINKFDLLSLVSKEYGKEIAIHPKDDFKIDRSLNSDRFRLATGFQPEPWPELIYRMHQFK